MADYTVNPDPVTEVKPAVKPAAKIVLPPHIEELVSKYATLARAYNKWQRSLESQAITRLHDREVYKNLASDIGQHAQDTIDAIGHLANQLSTLMTVSKTSHEAIKALEEENKTLKALSGELEVAAGSRKKKT